MSVVDKFISASEWLRNDVRQIVFRNLWMETSDITEVDLHFPPNLSLQIYAVTSENERHAIFDGPTIQRCCNPSWTIAGGCSSLNSGIFDSRDMVLLISDVGNGTVSMVERKTIQISLNLTDLQSVGSILLVNVTSLPINSIFFVTDSGYFVSSSLFNILAKSGFVVATNRLVADEESEAAALEVKLMREKMAASSLLIDRLRDDANELLNFAVQCNHRNGRVCRRAEMEQLRRDVASAELAASQSLAAEATEREELRDVSILSSSAILCSHLSKSIALRCADNLLREKELINLLFLSECRQSKILDGLRRVYPIVLLESGDYSIRGAELPADPHCANSGQRDDEQIATALGYAVHVLVLISKYLDITLRYHLVFNSSRSCIGDSASHNQGTITASVILPLYKKGVEKERFQRAIIWLGRDVHQILIFMGLEYESKKNFLYNVNKIFTCYSTTEKLAL